MTHEEVFIQEHIEEFNSFVATREEAARIAAEEVAQRESRLQSLRDQIANLTAELEALMVEAPQG